MPKALLTTLVAVSLVIGAALVVASDESRPEPDSPARDAGAPRVPPRLEGRLVDTIGVASMNAYHHLERPQAKADWDRITGNASVDLIGWQESRSEVFADLYPDYRARGWETWHWPTADGPYSNAVSWRARTFTLVDVETIFIHEGLGPGPDRWVVQVSLRHRKSGMVVTLLNAHVIHDIETGHGWQDNRAADLARLHYRRLTTIFDEAPGDVVVGTGDYNWDYADDSTYRPAGGISRTVARHAQSSYAVLGLDGVQPTHGTRWIDYVWLANRSVRRNDGSGTAQFARHRSLGGFKTDHRPLVARIRLYAD